MTALAGVLEVIDNRLRGIEGGQQTCSLSDAQCLDVLLVYGKVIISFL